MQKETIPAEKISIQAVDLKMNDYLHRKIRKMTDRLKTIIPDLNWIDIYLKQNADAGKPRTVTIRFGIPGPDLVATESGTKWKMIFRNAEKKLLRQIEKRKYLWSKGKENVSLIA